MFVNNSVDTVDAPLSKNIYGFRTRVYSIEHFCINILNEPMWSSWAEALCVQW